MVEPSSQVGPIQLGRHITHRQGEVVSPRGINVAQATLWEHTQTIRHKLLTTEYRLGHRELLPTNQTIHHSPIRARYPLR